MLWLTVYALFAVVTFYLSRRGFNRFALNAPIGLLWPVTLPIMLIGIAYERFS
ncbi:MAG: hypothetical protein KF805_12590 [Phycisphaeraceae bacterium]|nr:hypothetical protein [Phycisphaeraceae bacterium]